MNDYGIKPEWKEAWQVHHRDAPRGDFLLDNLANLSAHLLAKLMESEFRYNHWTYDTDGELCAECGNKKDFDPHHAYQHDDWLRVAREELGK